MSDFYPSSPCQIMIEVKFLFKFQSLESGISLSSSSTGTSIWSCKREMDGKAKVAMTSQAILAVFRRKWIFFCVHCWLNYVHPNTKNDRMTLPNISSPNKIQAELSIILYTLPQTREENNSFRNWSWKNTKIKAISGCMRISERIFLC